MEFRSGLLPGQLREIERQAAVENYFKLVRGNAAALAVALDLTDEEIGKELALLIANDVEAAIIAKDHRFWKSLKRAEEKFRFLVSE